jgi:hypothetical protein
MEVSGQLQAPAALPQGKSPWYPLDRRLGGPQSRSGHGRKIFWKYVLSIFKHFVIVQESGKSKCKTEK